MTESKAKKKWCPMVRYTQNFNDIMSNRDFSVEHTYCISSDCMMWRWEKLTTLGEEIGEGSKRIGVARGYCGLGGKP